MLLGFKKRFVSKIEDGTKIHTFRAKRKITPKVGEKIFPYTGLRTSCCQKIFGEYYYKSRQQVRMVLHAGNIGNGRVVGYNIHIGDKRTWDIFELNNMAVNDGFNNIYDFFNYWLDGKDKIVFSGHCYHWTDFKY